MNGQDQEVERIIASVSRKIESEKITMIPRWRLRLEAWASQGAAFFGLVLFIGAAGLLTQKALPALSLPHVISCLQGILVSTAALVFGLIAAAYAFYIARKIVSQEKSLSSIATAALILMAATIIGSVGIQRHSLGASSAAIIEGVARCSSSS